MVVVGVAASAGGLEALSQFITNLPANSNMAYVVVQHLAPQHRSMLTQLLSRQTRLKVVETVDGQKLVPNVVHITPPNHDLDIKDGVLYLRTPHAAVGPKPSADYFFTSLAEDQGENAVGIILSGTGSDGAHGVRAIKAAGGFTMAQDEASAKYHSMPRAAIETGCVDFVLPPGEIARELAIQVCQPRRSTLSPDSEEAKDGIARVLTLLKRRLGLDFTNYKKTTIGRRLKRRMTACKVDTLEDYLVYIETNPAELEQLRNDILISVTAFFRDEEAYEALARVIPDMVRDKKPGDSIRVWVVAAASGEEAYSIAIQLAETLGEDLYNHHVQIFATDVDLDALARARRAIYPDASVKNLSKEMLNKYFVARGGYYQVVKWVRDMVVFAKHDLIQDPPFLRMDLISCRNLLIYFNTTLQAKVINIFHYALNPGKYLLLGKSESVGAASSLFHNVDKKWKLYRRMGESRQIARELAGIFHHRLNETPRLRGEPREPTLADLVYNTLIDTFAPPVVVTDRDGRILHIHGDTSECLMLKSGSPDLNVFSMVRRELKSELRTTLLRAQQTKTPTESIAVRVGLGKGEFRRMRVGVRPLESLGDGMFLISFETVETEIQSGGQVQDGAENNRIAELEQELAATRENLQTVVEELETSNEELQSLNEEMQASNEELQSSNEELETSNEELQSTNEELTTVNEELQIKSAELAAANADLENIQNSIGFPLIVVDKSLRITRFNPAAKLVFDLLPDDVGQMITAVPCHLDIQSFRDRLRKVIDTGQIFETQVDQSLRSYWLRFVPYRDERGQVSGIVLTFIDNTQLRQSERLLRESESRFRAMAESIREVFWLMDARGRMIYVSPAAEDMFGIKREALMKSPEMLFDLAHPEDRSILDSALDHRRDKELSVEFRINRKDGMQRWIWLQVFPARHDQEGQPVGEGMTAGIAVDITRIKEVEGQLRLVQRDLESRVEERTRELTEEINERRRAERLAELANRAKTEFLANISHELRTPLNAIIGFSEMMGLEKFGPIGDAKYGEYVRIITESAHHLLDLINDVLDVSKIEAGKMELDEGVVHLPDVVAVCFRLLRSRAERGRVELASDIPPDLPALYMDERRFKQILVNLLSNAVKFTLDGGIVRCHARMREDGGMEIVVTDSGVGMRSEDIPQALSIFGQVDNRLTRREEGAGLGLPLTKGLIELHGGAMTLDSREGVGTTVTVYLPPERVRPRVTAGVADD